MIKIIHLYFLYLDDLASTPNNLRYLFGFRMLDNTNKTIDTNNRNPNKIPIRISYKNMTISFSNTINETIVNTDNVKRKHAIVFMK